jgi:hypothetical protein
MSPQRDPWTGKDTAECIGMLAGTAGALAAWTGHLSIDDMGAYAHTITELAVPVAIGVGGAVLAVAAAILVLRHLRVLIAASVRLWWRYRRRWAVVMADHGLTAEAAGVVSVPGIVSVRTREGADVVTVRMLPGQSAGQWHDASASLAEEFGATDARVGFSGQRRTDIEIAFRRDGVRRLDQREPLALPSKIAHPLPLRLPVPEQHTRPAGDRVAVRLSGVQLQIVWARIVPQGNNGKIARPLMRQRWGLRGHVRWCTSWAAMAI